MKLIIDGSHEITNPTSRDIDEALRVFHTNIVLETENSHETSLRVTKSHDPTTVTLHLINYPRKGHGLPSTHTLAPRLAARYLKASLSMYPSLRSMLKFGGIVFGLLLVFFTVNTFLDPVSQKMLPTLGDKLTTIGQVIVPFVGFAGYMMWTVMATTRVRPKIARYLGGKLGVTIVEGSRSRWEIREKNLPRGCLVSILDLSVLMLLFFCPMVILLLGYILAQGGF